jgi:hypothetical protein
MPPRPNYPEPVQRICSIARDRRSKSSAIMLQSCVYWHVHTSLRAILPCCDSSDRLHMECGSREPTLVRWGLVCVRGLLLRCSIHARASRIHSLLTCWLGTPPWYARSVKITSLNDRAALHHSHSDASHTRSTNDLERASTTVR